MTREEAADLLDNLIGMVEDNQENDYDEALKMAIEALNVTDTNVGDTISRQAAIDAILHNQEVYSNNFGNDPIDKYTIAIIDNDAQTIAQLPSAQPRQTCEYWDSESNFCALCRPSAQPEPRWIPVKTRPMTEEERWYWEEHYGVEFEAEDAVSFDCQMPDDGQEIWVCSKCGNVWQDTCEVDEGIGLEGNGDWDDIVAWMPYERPSPWKGEAE